MLRYAKLFTQASSMPQSQSLGPLWLVALLDSLQLQRFVRNSQAGSTLRLRETSCTLKPITHGKGAHLFHADGFLDAGHLPESRKSERLQFHRAFELYLLPQVESAAGIPRHLLPDSCLQEPQHPAVQKRLDARRNYEDSCGWGSHKISTRGPEWVAKNHYRLAFGFL